MEKIKIGGRQLKINIINLINFFSKVAITPTNFHLEYVNDNPYAPSIDTANTQK
jgi:hypothetical protein